MATALGRRSAEGFLSLIPVAEPTNPIGMIEAISAIARDARLQAIDSRNAAMEAVWFEHQEMPGRAKQPRVLSAITHRAAARQLHALAVKVRELLEWAALDWLPTVDVAGSGLTEDELAVLCSVMGVPVDRLREAGDEARA